LEKQMKPEEIVKGIHNVGVNDWNIRDFHGYSTQEGTSYNAFLILDEKNVLIDTVKKEFTDQMMENIARIIDPRKIDYVISNHTEMDHSGGLPEMMRHVGEEKPIFCSKIGQKSLARHFTEKWNYRAVENGETLRIGSRTLTFLETRMLHWPDSMFTYLPEEKILFSSDAFGQHYAGMENFDDEIGEAVMPHAKKYFANILLLYAPLILKLMETVSRLGLEFKMICPDHGVIWRKDPGKILAAYRKWSRQETAKKAVVVFDTMWNSTEAMAEAIAAGLNEEGIEVRPMHLRRWHRSDVMTEVLDARGVAVGSPTLNNGLFPTLGDFLAYMKGLKPKDKIGAAFGSYGWSGEAVKIIRKELETIGFDLIEPSPAIQYVPDREGIASCVALGRKLGKAIRRSE
jgi:flavorubredoxin